MVHFCSIVHTHIPFLRVRKHDLLSIWSRVILFVILFLLSLLSFNFLGGFMITLFGGE
jgi:hypothetical protein